MTIPPAFPWPASALPQLTRLDLLPLEAVLCAGLRSFFNFSAHSFYFPPPQAEEAAQARLRGEMPEAGDYAAPSYLAGEKKLLLPLRQGAGELLGVFVARGVEHGVKGLLPLLPAVAGLCLDNAALWRQNRLDSLTGLYNQAALYEALVVELERLGAVLLPGGPGRPGYPAHTDRAGQFSLLLLRLNGLPEIVRAHGYALAEDLLRLLGRELQRLSPGPALAARGGEAELALLLPGLGIRGALDTAETLARALAETSLTSPLSGLKARLAPCVGCVVCPCDLSGLELYNPEEKSRRLLERAKLSAALASSALASSGSGPVLAYSRILQEGGRVLETRPFSRLLISLGAAAGARAGQNFSVWGREPSAGGLEQPARYKADIFITELGTDESLAEILRSDDPRFPPAAGDALRLGVSSPNYPQPPGFYPDDLTAAGEEAGSPAAYADFLPRWSLELEKHSAFSLILGRFSQLESAGEKNWEELMRVAARLCREQFGAALILGRYTLNSLILFLPGQAQGQTLRLLEELSGVLGAAGLDAAFGLAPHPFLDFHKAEALDNVNKALDYALLLPPPRIGGLDSLALNIFADKLYSQGDQLGAIAEYRRALLCDQDNILAWNSLGVALAELGRHNEARRNLEEALRRAPGDANTLYNLGNLRQSLRAFGEAREFYLRCLALEEHNVFVLYRLGRLAEEEGDFTEAEARYRQAAALPGGALLTRRGLARLSMKRGRPQEAREELHEALLLAPHDAVSLQLLAGLYLDAGEDPAVAESLARQSVALRPDLRPGWLELARALETLGKKNAAREALIRAGEL